MESVYLGTLIYLFFQGIDIIFLEIDIKLSRQPEEKTKVPKATARIMK